MAAAAAAASLLRTSSAVYSLYGKLEGESSIAVSNMSTSTLAELESLAKHIKQWGKSLGFQDVRICEPDLTAHEQLLQQWLEQGYHGEMAYMERHGNMRCRPEELHPGTIRVISARINYLPEHPGFADALEQPTEGYISRYAVGRDYHKLVRKRLNQLGRQIEQAIADLSFRPFVDSAPILERPLAEQAGLGWIGKHTLLLTQEAGSFFFLGELLVNLPLPVDESKTNQCGECVACMKICPTQAIIAPYQLDARRCISYLTIEHSGSIPTELREAIGNRIYGCDDCQLICPWNRYAALSSEQAFAFKSIWHKADLLALFSWSEEQFLKNTEGSPIRRIGYEKWQRNIAVALGNAPFDETTLKTLQKSRDTASPLVTEHIDWAIQRQTSRQHATALESRLTKRLIRSIRKGLPVALQ